MKTLKIILLICLAFPQILKAQNDILKEYGHNFKIVTLSNGKYEEFHDNDTIVEIGSALFNTKTGEIVGIKSNLQEALETKPQPQIISRWLSIDPLAEIAQESWTPYNYVKNNPVRFIDPDGMIWKDPAEADKLLDNTLDKLGSVTAKKEEAQWELDNNKDLSDKKKDKLQKKIDNLSDREASLKGSISDIIALGADQNHVYDLVTNTGETNHVKLGSDGVINIQGGNDAIHIHEIKHVSLSLERVGKLEFYNGFLKPTTQSGLLDEITAYSAQYGYDPSSLPGSVNSSRGINLEYIANLKKEDGTPVYPAIHQKWINYQKQKRINKKQQKQRTNDGN